MKLNPTEWHHPWRTLRRRLFYYLQHTEERRLLADGCVEKLVAQHGLPDQQGMKRVSVENVHSLLCPLVDAVQESMQLSVCELMAHALYNITDTIEDWKSKNGRSCELADELEACYSVPGYKTCKYLEHVFDLLHPSIPWGTHVELDEGEERPEWYSTDDECRKRLFRVFVDALKHDPTLAERWDERLGGTSSWCTFRNLVCRRTAGNSVVARESPYYVLFHQLSEYAKVEDARAAAFRAQDPPQEEWEKRADAWLNDQYNYKTDWLQMVLTVPMNRQDAAQHIRLLTRFVCELFMQASEEEQDQIGSAFGQGTPSDSVVVLCAVTAVRALTEFYTQRYDMSFNFSNTDIVHGFTALADAVKDRAPRLESALVRKLGLEGEAQELYRQVWYLMRHNVDGFVDRYLGDKDEVSSRRLVQLIDYIEEGKHGCAIPADWLQKCVSELAARYTPPTLCLSRHHASRLDLTILQAVRTQNVGLLRLLSTAGFLNAPAPAKQQWPHVYCDGAHCPNERRICGTHHKCTVCRDFDLCDACFQAHGHSIRSSSYGASLTAHPMISHTLADGIQYLDFGKYITPLHVAQFFRNVELMELVRAISDASLYERTQWLTGLVPALCLLGIRDTEIKSITIKRRKVPGVDHTVQPTDNAHHCCGTQDREYDYLDWNTPIEAGDVYVLRLHHGDCFNIQFMKCDPTGQTAYVLSRLRTGGFTMDTAHSSTLEIPCTVERIRTLVIEDGHRKGSILNACETPAPSTWQLLHKDVYWREDEKRALHFLKFGERVTNSMYVEQQTSEKRQVHFVTAHDVGQLYPRGESLTVLGDRKESMRNQHHKNGAQIIQLFAMHAQQLKAVMSPLNTGTLIDYYAGTLYVVNDEVYACIHLVPVIEVTCDVIEHSDHHTVLCGPVHDTWVYYDFHGRAHRANKKEPYTTRAQITLDAQGEFHYEFVD